MSEQPHRRSGASSSQSRQIQSFSIVQTPDLTSICLLRMEKRGDQATLIIDSRTIRLRAAAIQKISS